MNIGWRTRPHKAISHCYNENAISLCGMVHSSESELTYPEPDREGGRSCAVCLQIRVKKLNQQILNWLGA